MALQRNTKYPGRYDNPTAGQPQGPFRNRTTAVSTDGSYFERDWLNDWSGFFSSILNAQGVSANGNVDAVGASQYFDALRYMTIGVSGAGGELAQTLVQLQSLINKSVGVSGAGGDLTQTLIELQSTINKSVGVSGTGGDLTQTLVQAQAILDNAALKTNNGLAGNYEVILASGQYTSGTYSYPNSHTQSQYDLIVLSGSNTAISEDILNSVTVTKEHIADYPTTWRATSHSEKGNRAAIRHSSTTSFEVSNFGNDQVRFVIGYLKEGVS